MRTSGTALRSLVLLTLIMVGVAVTGAGTPTMVVNATPDPCAAVSGNPDPPEGPPQPEISGAVTDSGSSAPIQGASMKLYQCSGSSSTLFATTTTNSSGHYAFTGLTSQKWYYVEAVMSGSLAGMTPSGATSNPTDAIGIGNSATGVNLTFQ